MQHSSRTRRGLATALSGTLVAGAVAGAVVGTAGSASAAEVPVVADFKSVCKVTVGGQSLGDRNIKFHLETMAEVPLVPGANNKKQDVSVTLTMPKALHKATVDLIGATHIKGHSPDSAVDLKLPIIGGETAKERIELKNLAAPKSKIPPTSKPWTVTSNGVVPKQHVPGFAGDGVDDPPPFANFATLKLAPRFTIKSTLFAGKKRFPSTMKCTVNKNDRVINDQVPVEGPWVTDTLPVHATTGFGKATEVQLVFFHKPGSNIPPNGNTWTEPEHGTLTPGPEGLFTYTPDKGFAGTDSFTYTATDDTGESTSKVTVNVKKAPTNLKVRAPKSIKFGKPANVRVTVMSKGSTKGKITLQKGKRVLDKATVKGGKAKLTVKRKALKVGKHKLQVKFAGSKTAKKATKKLTLRVKKR